MRIVINDKVVMKERCIYMYDKFERLKFYQKLICIIYFAGLIYMLGVIEL